MIFRETSLPGVFLIAMESKEDDRGSFARAYCANEFKDFGLESRYVQANLCINNEIGIIRGLHLQSHPFSEVKMVRCIQGAIYDVVVDMREDSPTYRQWTGAELSGDNGLMMYVPKGFAHGYQTLKEHAVAYYMVSAFYEQCSEYGYRFDDPKLQIEWPLVPSKVSKKDLSWPFLV